MYFRKLQYFLYEHDFMKQDATKYIENPLHGFGMIKRATADLSLIMKRIPSQHAESLQIYRIHDSSLVHAVKSLLLIQRIYKLQSRDIARGVMQNRRVGDKMSPHDLYVIGDIASNFTNEEFFAKEYLELALEKHGEGHDRKWNEINESNLLMKIARLCERMHDYRCAALHLKQLMLNDPNDVEVAAYALNIVKLIKEQSDTKIQFDDPFSTASVHRDGQFTPRKEFELVSNVCRGKLNGNAARSTELHCNFVISNSFSKIAPFKAEVVNFDPLIVLFHDVLSDVEIQSLKKLARQQKSISNVIRMTSLYDKENELLASISQRIEVIQMKMRTRHIDFLLKYFTMRNIHADIPSLLHCF